VGVRVVIVIIVVDGWLLMLFDVVGWLLVGCR